MQPTTVSETVSMAHSANVTFDIKLVVLTVAQTLPAITGIDASKNVNQVFEKGYFRIIRNERDKRSIFILPSVITIKTFEEFIDRRDILYKGIK